MCHILKYINHKNMESLPLWVLGNPNTKSILMASHGFSGIGNG
jgi:hypothetical protein